jgi:molybdopterin synthase catalytic subunit
VSGMVQTTVTDQPLSVVEHESAVAHPGAGAVVSFAGVVRDHDGGRGVARLTYKAHPSAAAVLAEVAAEIAKDPAVHGLAVSHRVGELAVGDVALAAAVSTAHRGDAFAICARLVDEVKARLPVWKHQYFADGTEEWVNSP